MVDLGFTGTATKSRTIPSATQITIPAGSPTGSSPSPPCQTPMDENNETVIVDITCVTNATEIGTQQESATITDDDPSPAVTLSVNNSSIGETGGVAILTATLSAASSLP